MTGSSVNGVGLTLDDLRQPAFNGRVWGYDKAEVDRLLAAVITSIERLQSRRERDAAAVERATGEATEATARAERAERERDDLAFRLELALQGAKAGDDGAGLAGDHARDDQARDSRDGGDRDDRDGGGPAKVAAAALDEAERRVAQAQDRAGRAERQVLVLREEMAKQRARTRQAAGVEAEVGELRKELASALERARRPVAPPVAPAAGDPLAPSRNPITVAVERLFEKGDPADAAVMLPLAQRAARALLREARTAAAAIVAEAEQQAALQSAPAQASTIVGTSSGS